MKRPSDMTLGAILLGLGAFAGFCLGRFTSNLAPNPLQMQWDIGNTFVGVATTIVAFTSIWIALTSKRREGQQKVATFRMEWIEELRSELSQFMATMEDCAAWSSKNRAHESNFEEYDKFFSQAAKLKYSIRLRMSEKEEDHVKIINAINSIIKLMTSIVDPDKKNETNTKSANELKEKISELEYISRKVLKSEWQRVKTEVKEGT